MKILSSTPYGIWVRWRGEWINLMINGEGLLILPSLAMADLLLFRLRKKREHEDVEYKAVPLPMYNIWFNQ